jgi:hypothetical protein
MDLNPELTNSRRISMLKKRIPKWDIDHATIKSQTLWPCFSSLVKEKAKARRLNSSSEAVS